MLARLGEHLLEVGDAREDRRDGDEAHADRVGEQPRDRGLAGAGRPPQDHRGELARRDHPPDRAVRPGQMLLADHLVERARPQPVGERRIVARRGARVRLGRVVLEEIGHARRPLEPRPCRSQSSRPGHIAAAPSPGGPATSARGGGRQAAARADDGEVDRLRACRSRRSSTAPSQARPMQRRNICRRSCPRPKRCMKRRAPGRAEPRLGRRDQGDALGAVGGDPEPQPPTALRPALRPTSVDARRGDRRRRGAGAAQRRRVV